MNSEALKRLLAQPEYDFLRTNSRLGPNIILLTLGGSHAYGTNIEDSDVDIRGIAANSFTDILGMRNFEQVADSATDTTVYSLRKASELLMGGNPSMIEMLGCRPQDYIYLDKRGVLLLDNRQLFLSRKTGSALISFARHQLRDMKALSKQCGEPNTENAKMINQDAQTIIDAFSQKYKEMPEGSITLEIVPNFPPHNRTEIMANISLENFPLRKFKLIAKDLGAAVSQYGNLDKKAKNGDGVKNLNKYAMHTVRLCLMGLDILEKGELNTYRDKDHSLLMDIRNGKFRLPDGNYGPDFFEYVAELEKRLRYAMENTNLPDEPDFDKVQELVMEINRMTIEQAFV